MSTQPPSDAPVHSLAARKILVVVLGIPAAAAFTALLLQYKGLVDVEAFGLPENYLYVAAFAVIVLAIVAIVIIWRCPGCRTYLGREFNPARCPSCGAQFR
jgi:rubrerythrin